VLNVDGYLFTWDTNGDRLFRKNRVPNPGSTCVGTDPNRNFKDHWSQEYGGEADPCTDDYWGSAAFTSAEALSIAKYVKSLGNVVSYIDFHSYSELFMYPYGWLSDVTNEVCQGGSPDASTQGPGATDAVNAIQAVNGETFTSGDVCDTIYPASGNSIDYMYSEAGVTYAYAIELRPNANDASGNGFLLPADQILPAAKETWAGMQALWNYISPLV
ncbi:hypothetical protein BDK51DRAFT_25221, partial [Blyttiomyces helicus]